MSGRINTYADLKKAKERQQALDKKNQSSKLELQAMEQQVESLSRAKNDVGSVFANGLSKGRALTVIEFWRKDLHEKEAASFQNWKYIALREQDFVKLEG